MKWAEAMPFTGSGPAGFTKSSEVALDAADAALVNRVDPQCWIDWHELIDDRGHGRWSRQWLCASYADAHRESHDVQASGLPAHEHTC